MEAMVGSAFAGRRRGQILLLCVGMAAVSGLPACSKKRSTSSNPTAFCTASKKNLAEFMGLRENPTQVGAKEYAAALRKTSQVAPVELEASMKTITDDWRNYLNTGDMKPMTGTAYAAAVDQINTWESEFCK
jgi:hypothetical protein